MATTLTAPARGRYPAVAPALPAVATVLLLCVPGGAVAGLPGGAGPADLASAALVLWCALTLPRSRRRPLTPLAATVLGAPAVALGLAAVTSPAPQMSLPGLARALQVFVLVPAALVLLLRSRRDFRLVAAALVLVALVQGAVGTHQYLTGTGALYQGRTLRAVGTFGPQDVMGMSTVVAYGLVAALALGLAPPVRSPRWVRPAALSCAAVLTVPLALSFSRGAWISTAVAGTVVLLLAGVRTALRVLAALLAAGVVLVAATGVNGAMFGERISSITQVTDSPDRSVADRYALWGAAAGMWREAPLTGVGVRGFPLHRDSHASLGLSSGSDTAGAGREFRREPLLSPHNMYLLVLSEQGLTGFVALVGGWAVLLALTLARVRPRRRAGRLPAPGRDCGLVAAGLLVWTCVDFLYADLGGPSTVLTAVVLGLAAWWALSPAARAAPEAGER